MSNIAIIHFAPLEFYPPIQNMLGELGKLKNTTQILVFTSQGSLGSLKPFTPKSTAIKVIRLGKSDAGNRPLMRYWNYVIFYGSSLFLLLRYRPYKVLYYETISSWPVYVYKRFIKLNCQVYIHYHEYTTSEEYRQGMKLTRYFHEKEKWLYPRAEWISHTNEFRMSLFKKDTLTMESRHTYILPNYPSVQWSAVRTSAVKKPVKVVYVGSFSLTTMYTKEFAAWITSQKGSLTWDIYSYNLTQEAKAYIQSLGSEWITLKDGVNYDQLPEILSHYDVGVVLYNGHIPNYIYNAPNKLFEYLACGLDVWFPEIMIGSLEYVKTQGFPKVLAIDFNTLDRFNLPMALDRVGPSNKFGFFHEEALKPLVHKLTTG